MEIIEQQCLSLNWLMFQESEGLGPLSKKKDKKEGNFLSFGWKIDL